MGLSGIAESMPTSRRRVAGALRLTAVVVLVATLAIMLARPELLTG